MKELIGRIIRIHLLDENQQNVFFEVLFLLLEARYIKRDKDFRKNFNKLRMELKNLETEEHNTLIIYFTKNGNLSDFSDENGILNLKEYFRDFQNPNRTKDIYDYLFLLTNKDRILKHLVLFSDQQ